MPTLFRLWVRENREKCHGCVCLCAEVLSPPQGCASLPSSWRGGKPIFFSHANVAWSYVTCCWLWVLSHRCRCQIHLSADLHLWARKMDSFNIWPAHDTEQNRVETCYTNPVLYSWNEMQQENFRVEHLMSTKTWHCSAMSLCIWSLMMVRTII